MVYIVIWICVAVGLTGWLAIGCCVLATLKRELELLNWLERKPGLIAVMLMCLWPVLWLGGSMGKIREWWIMRRVASLQRQINYYDSLVDEKWETADPRELGWTKQYDADVSSLKQRMARCSAS